jgi:hypothetical protein
MMAAFIVVLHLPVIVPIVVIALVTCRQRLSLKIYSFCFLEPGQVQRFVVPRSGGVRSALPAHHEVDPDRGEG